MVKTLSTLFIIFFFCSCQTRVHQNKAMRQIASEKTYASSSTSFLDNQDLPNLAKTWDSDVYLVNFNPEQEAKVHKAVALIKKVIGSKEFRDGVLNYTYRGKKTFNDNNGLSNLEIYHKILNSSETLIPGNNNTMDVELELYHQTTNTIGYTYPNTVRIWMNTKYFDRYTPVNVADNLTHEWLHKLGFVHASTYSKDRDATVPYAIGYLVEELAQKFYSP